jgi:hypothetical protein
LNGIRTGAITGVVDRLEKAGFVRRERDESDRRKVYIVPVVERMMEMGRPYELMKRAMQKQSLYGCGAEVPDPLRDRNLPIDAGSDDAAQRRRRGCAV